MVTPLKITLALALSWFVLVGAASAEEFCPPNKVTGTIIGMILQNNPSAELYDVPKEDLPGFVARFNAAPPETSFEISSVYYFKRPDTPKYYLVIDLNGCAITNGEMGPDLFHHLRDGTPLPLPTNLREVRASHP